MAITWPIQYAQDPPPVLGVLEPAVRAMLEEMAVDYLWMWTRRVYGLVDVTIRPTWVQKSTAGLDHRLSLVDGVARFTQSLFTERVVAAGDGLYAPIVWRTDCGCGGACGAVIRLPWPTHEVTEVRVGGIALDPTAYRLDDHQLLVRQDGSAWPAAPDLDAPAGTPGTWEVDLAYGKPVPVGGQVAAGLLAIELAKAFTGDNTCQLPKRVQSITRQGVTVAMLDSFDDLSEGRTGIWLVDSWVASIVRPPRGGRVYSVDVGRGR